MATQTTNLTGETLIERLAERIGGRAGAGTVFGDPVTQGDITVIPVARTSFGFGGGTGPDPTNTDRRNEGGGGGAITKPIGFIELDPTGARYRAIGDRRLLAMVVALGAAGLLLVIRTARRRRGTRPFANRMQRRRGRFAQSMSTPDPTQTADLHAVPAAPAVSE